MLAQDNIDTQLLQIEINAKPVAIISTETFTPRAQINGFGQINPGINLSTADITGDGVGKYYGIAEKAESLIVAGETEPVLAADSCAVIKLAQLHSQLKVNTDDGVIIGSGNPNLH